MSDNEIRVVITGVASDLRRALDGAKGDLGGLTAAIKAVPDTVKVDVQAQTATATARLRELRQLAKDVPNRIDIQANADTGVAAAKLRLLERQARQTEEAIARAQLGSLISSGRGGGGSGGFLSSLSGGPGAFGQGTAATAGLAPFAAAGAGSAGALIGSAGAATLGLGALATSVLGVGGVGLGSMLAVITQAKAGITSVSTALDNLTAAQVKYGKGSSQAASAQKDLNAAIADAGPQASLIARQLEALATQWTQVSAPATKALDQIIVPGLKLVSELMPTVAGIARQSFAAIGQALDPVFKGLASPAFKRVLTDLGDAFAKLAAPMTDAFANLMRAFFSVAVAAAPYLIQIAKAFDDWTRSFAASLAPGQHLNDLIGNLVGQLHSWWNLATALGRLMITVFSAGAGTGQQLVGQLTTIVDRWNAWLDTGTGQQAMRRFFTDSANLLKAVLSTLAPIVGLISQMSIGLIPTMTLLLAPLARLLASIAGWINGLSKDLPPVINALPGLAVAVGVLASWMALKSVVASTAALITGKLGIGAAAAGSVGSVAPAVEGGVGSGLAVSGAMAALKTGLTYAIGFAIFGALAYGVSRWLTQDARQAGQRFATAFTADLPGQISDATKQGLAHAYNQVDLRRHVLDAQQIAAGRPTPTRGGGHQIQPHGPDAAQAANYFNEGFKAGNAVVQGFQAVKFPTELLMVPAFIDKLRTLAPAARGEAARIMVGFAETLQQNGKLPQGAVNRMIDLIEGQFPGLVSYLNQAGLNSAQAIAQGLKLTDARKNLTGALHDFRAQWGDTAIATKITNANINQNTAQAMDDLQLLMHSKSQRIRTEAKAEYDLLASDTNQSFQAMVNQTDASMSHMAALIQAGSASAANVAGQNFATLSKAVHDGMASGVLSTTQGTRLIGQALNAELKAFGQAPIPLAGLSAGDLAAWQNWWQGGSASQQSGGIGHRAGGGYIGSPGERGTDNIPIVVGAGEAILNFHQQAPVEAALQHTFGMGLGDLFSNVTQPHYMATGGFAGPKGSGGQATGGTGVMGRMVQMANSINARHFPYLWGGGHNSSFTGPYDCSGAVSAVLHAGGLLAAPEVSGQMMGIGSPGAGRVSIYANPTHVYMSLDGHFFGTSGANPGGGAGWFAGAARPGFVVRHFDPSGTAGGIGGRSGGAGGLPPISAPRVRGSGTVPTLVRGALGNAAKAANTLLAKTSVAGGGGSVGGGNLNENLANQAVGRSMMLAAGWPASQWPFLQALWSQESGWDPWATNPSGAYGIPQALGHGHPYALGAVRPQIAWGLNYIRGRYGSPAAAEAHEQSAGWYARGGFAGGRQRFAATGKRPGAPRLSVGSPGSVRNLSQVAHRVTRELQAATDLSNRYSGLAGSFSIVEAAPKYTNPDGSLNQAGVAKHIADDRLLIGLDHRMLSIYEHVEPELAEALKHVLGSVSADQRQITSDQHQVSANQKRISALRSEAGRLKGPAKHRIMLQIAALSRKNSALSGAATRIRSLLSGAGGGGSENQALSTLENAASSFGTVLWGRGGRFAGIDQRDQGVIFTTKLDLQALGQDITKTAGTASLSPNLTTLNQLLSTQLQTAQQALAVSQAQFGVFSGLGLTGSYQSGIGYVPKTGPALLHRGEMVLPDPYGPQANRAAATVQTAHGPIEVIINMGNSEPPLMKVIDARINQRALQVISDHSGQRARLMAGVR